MSVRNMDNPRRIWHDDSSCFSQKKPDELLICDVARGRVGEQDGV